jgi:hypothetical protein
VIGVAEDDRLLAANRLAIKIKLAIKINTSEKVRGSRQRANHLPTMINSFD